MQVSDDETGKIQTPPLGLFGVWRKRMFRCLG